MCIRCCLAVTRRRCMFRGSVLAIYLHEDGVDTDVVFRHVACRSQSFNDSPCTLLAQMKLPDRDQFALYLRHLDHTRLFASYLLVGSHAVSSTCLTTRLPRPDSWLSLARLAYLASSVNAFLLSLLRAHPPLRYYCDHHNSFYVLYTHLRFSPIIASFPQPRNNIVLPRFSQHTQTQNTSFPPHTTHNHLQLPLNHGIHHVRDHCARLLRHPPDRREQRRPTNQARLLPPERPPTPRQEPRQRSRRHRGLQAGLSLPPSPPSPHERNRNAD